MLARVYSAFPYGLEAKLVDIEVDIEPGIRSFHIIGLPDEAVKEAGKRVSLALKRSGFKAPHQMNKKVTVNLAPADLKKQGSFFDAAIAVGFLVASLQIPPPLQKTLFIGELSLKGELRPVPGALGIGLFAKKHGIPLLVMPRKNAIEASLVDGITPLGLSRLSEVAEADFLKKLPRVRTKNPAVIFSEGEAEYDFSDIHGQNLAKRALEIAGAGAHHLFMVGPPGAGKSILARSFPSLLPILGHEEGLEVATILSAFGGLFSEYSSGSVILKRPFRSPHHTASAQAILGGGSPVKPGEITLAHQGVLFLDEWPEFRRDVLEGLRQPLEDSFVKIARSNERFTFPARFQLVGASNPCPCGFKDDPLQACICTPGALNRYERKLSGPLMDRIDLFVSVPRLTKEEILLQGKGGDSSFAVRERVAQAQHIQQKRFGKAKTNGGMTLKEVKIHCAPGKEGMAFLSRAIESFRLSMRGYHKVLKVARTIADLEGSEHIKQKHIAEALQYRKTI
ncbi:MAG: YifB family Mg chelatase-like AAA ATPase [Candidatus Colwellbacteria bacterium]|nr:YifB family Mg chelatase-like AAA ATPase [Candidatus Colwellbacteria bacterium]